LAIGSLSATSQYAYVKHTDLILSKPNASSQKVFLQKNDDWICFSDLAFLPDSMNQETILNDIFVALTASTHRV
jgi:hypothetical protein